MMTVSVSLVVSVFQCVAVHSTVSRVQSVVVVADMQCSGLVCIACLAGVAAWLPG